MKASKKGGKALRVIGRAMIFLGAGVLIFLGCFDLWIKPTLDRISVYQCGQIADKVISRAICEHMADTQEEALSLVSFSYDESGKICALQTDPVSINRLKAMLTEFINDELSSSRAEEVGVSLGTLTGISYLYGRGNELVFSVKPIGNAKTRLLSSFESAGINQTLHSIVLEVDTVLSPLIPGFTESVEVTTDFILAQTVLIGEVPETFSNIVLDSGSVSELADFNLTG